MIQKILNRRTKSRLKLRTMKRDKEAYPFRIRINH
jgi:hypothetical protein